MSGLHKIELNGFGRIQRVLYAGHDTYIKSNDKLQIVDTVIDKNNKSLVEIYKTVKRKYYPEYIKIKGEV